MSPARVRLLVRWLLRLRWRSVWRERTYAVSAIMLFTFGGLGLLTLHPALALFLWEFLQEIPGGNRDGFLGLALALGYGAWVLLGDGLRALPADSAPLLRLPFGRRERIVASTLAEFVDPFRLFEAAAFVLPPLAVLAAVGVRSPGEGLLRGLGLLLLWLSALATRQLLRITLRLSALRDPVGLALAGGVFVWLAALLMELRAFPWSLDARAWQEPLGTLKALWPPAWAAQVIASDGGGSAAMGLVALAATAVLMLGARVYLEERAESRAAPRDRARRLRGGWSGVPFVEGMVGILVLKGLRELLRDPLLRRVLGGSLAVMGMIVGFLLLYRSWLAPYRAEALLGSGLFAVWILCPVKANTIAFERGGLPRLLVLPLSWRRVLLGLDLAQGLWTAVILAGTVGTAAVVLGAPEGFFRAWAASTATIAGCLAVMHATSALFPVRIERDARTITMPAAPGFFYTFVSLAIMGVEIGLLAAISAPWDLGAVALWNALIYGISVLLAPRTFGLREWGLWI